MSLSLAFTACDDDPVDGPSESESLVDFPQGDHDYDKEFVAFKDKFGTMPLYKFTEVQFRWAFNSYIPYYANPGDEAYVGKAWKLIYENGLKNWPEDFLKQMLPYQIMLADSIYSLTGTSATGYTKVVRNSCYGYSHMAFGFANKSIDEMTVEQKREAVGDVAYALVGYAVSKEKMTIPERFDTLFTRYRGYYTQSFATGTNWSYWGYNFAGTLDGSVEATNGYSVEHDFALYVKYMTMMSEESFKKKFLNDSFDCGGVLDKDQNPVREHPVQNKYEAVRDFFKEKYGIDLSAIGAITEKME